MTDFNALLERVAGRAVPAGLAEALEIALLGRDINTPLRIAHFLAQVCAETGGFLYMVELGGPGYFAKYDGRADLGNSEPGDGFKFRGRGLVQLTGRANYAKYGAALDLPLVAEPDLASHPVAAAAIAALYWQDHHCNALADADNLMAVTRAINGGLNGFAARKDYLARAKLALAALQARPEGAPASPQPRPAPVDAPPVLPAPEPVPAAPEPAPAPPAPPAAPPDTPDLTPLWKNLVTMARDRIASWGGGGVSIGAAALAVVHKLSPFETALLVLFGVLVLIAVLHWGAKKEHRNDDEKRQALAAAPPQTPISGPAA